MLKSFTNAFKGISDALKSEHNLRIHFLASVLVFALAIFLKFTHQEFAILTVTIFFVITLELINTSIKFRFIGFQISDYDQIAINSLPKNVEFLGRISRFDVIKEIDKFDVGLVIYPDTDYFLDSFPIKIVEYAARHIPIIASNTRANKRILENDKALYFSLDASSSLIECINKVAQDKKIAESISSSAFEWVKLLTYENRAIKVLNKADPNWAGSYER